MTDRLLCAVGSTGYLVGANDGATAGVAASGELEGDLVGVGGDADRGPPNDVGSAAQRGSGQQLLSRGAGITSLET